jgi:ribosomal protein S18 acetylase RimI-like enzyme
MKVGNFNISLMELGDIPESAKVLSIAMLNNPMHMAVFQGNGEDERLEIEKMFLDLFSTVPGIVFLAKANDNIIGVMRMKSCVGGKTTDEAQKPEDGNDISSRQAIWHREWSNQDPQEQHWHLGPIGVLPAYRGKGIGSKLMERFCKEVDRCAAKAFLETDLDENVRFYEKFGFNLILEKDILQIPNRFMVRDSRM